MKEVKTALENDTTGWSGSPRLITVDETAQITGNNSFNLSTISSSRGYFDTNSQSPDQNREPGTSKYACLFGRIYYCVVNGWNITDNTSYGYWTSTAIYVLLLVCGS